MSSHATIISLTSVLHEFNDNDIAVFKNFLFQQLNIENDVQFICAFLQTVFKPLNSSILDVLHQKANQMFTESQYQPFQPKNHFESIPSGVIQNIATYLSKKQSVELGYINRYLYNESQNSSYIIACSQHNQLYYDKMYKDQRFSDYYFESKLPSELVMKTNKLHQMALAGSVGCSFSYPQVLCADTMIDEKILNIISQNDQKKRIFNNIFSKLKCFNVSDCSILGLVPVHLLFNKQNNPNSNLLSFEMGYPRRNTLTFAKNYSNYASQVNFEVRELEELSISFHPNSKDENYYVNTLLHSFNGNFKILELNEGILSIKDPKSFVKIFHNNLKALHFSWNGGINVTRNLNNLMKQRSEIDVNCAKLKLFELDTCDQYTISNNEVTIFECQMASKILCNIEMYKICWFRHEPVTPGFRSSGYVCEFLRENLGVNPVCSKIKQIKFIVTDEEVDDNESLICGDTRDVLHEVCRFNKNNIINAAQHFSFQYFCIEWCQDGTGNAKHIDQSLESIIHVKASQDQQITLNKLNISESYNIIDVKTDFSEAMLRRLHQKIIDWIQYKDETNQSIDGLQVRLHP